MLRYVLGYSPSRRCLARLPLRVSARLGKGLALLSALGWAVLIRYAFLPMMFPSAEPSPLAPDWFWIVAAFSILPDFFYGRAIAERDLEARIDTDSGVGRRWRWALALQFWGVWAYWLIAVRQLPEPRHVLVAEGASHEARTGPEDHAV
jgi:hypothetical protein